MDKQQQLKFRHVKWSSFGIESGSTILENQHRKSISEKRGKRLEEEDEGGTFLRTSVLNLFMTLPKRAQMK